MALSLVSPEVCRGQGESLTAVRGVPPTLHSPLTVQTCTNTTVHFGDHKCTNKLNACACVVDLKKKFRTGSSIFKDADPGLEKVQANHL